MVHRLPHARVAQGAVELVVHTHANVRDRTANHCHARIGFDHLDLIRGQVAGELVLPGAQAVHALRQFPHLHEAQRAERRPAAPVVVVRIEHQLDVRRVAADLVGPGADRLTRIGEPRFGLFEGAPVYDLRAHLAQPAFQRHIGRHVHKPHGVFVDRDDLVERWPQAAADRGNLRWQGLRLLRRPRGVHVQRLVHARRRRRAEHMVRTEGEHHVLGGEFVAVMEFDALAQRYFQRTFVDTAPACGELRHLLQRVLKVASDQQFHVGVEDALADIGLFRDRVQRVAGRQRLHSDGDLRPCVGLADGKSWQGRGRAGQGQQAAASNRWHGASPLCGHAADYCVARDARNRFRRGQMTLSSQRTMTGRR